MSKTQLTRQDIVDILYSIGVPRIQDKYVYSEKPNMQICCPIHGESTPSMGVNVDTLQTHCFACHFKGSLTWLVYNARKDDFKGTSEVNDWIYRKYGVDLEEQERQAEEFNNRQLIRYEDKQDEDKELSTIKVLPRSFLAPYRSGKETYKYFFKRGFTKETMEKFKVGRDVSERLVTIPIHLESGDLVGMIGRYIDKKRPKNSRYAVREVPKAEVTFPQDHLEVIDDTIIIVEGLLDAMWMHQLGFTNTQSILGNEMSYQQRDYLVSKASKFIDMTDNDTGGDSASERINRLLKGYTIYQVKDYYPEGAKDPQDCTFDEIVEMLNNKHTKLTNRRRRYE